MRAPSHQTAHAFSHLHTAGRERLSRFLLNVLASSSDSPFKNSFFMDCGRTLGKNPLEARARFYYYPIPIANMPFAKRVDYMTRLQKPSMKILASGISSYQAGQAGISKLGLLDLKKISQYLGLHP